MIIRELNQQDRENPEKLKITLNPKDTFQITLEKNPLQWGQKFFPENIDLLAQNAEDKTPLAKIGVGNSEFRFNGETLKAGYIYDMELKSQKQEDFSRLWAAMSIHAEESNLSFLFCYLPKNLEILSKINPPVKPQILGTKTIYLLPTHKPMVSSKKAGHFTTKTQETKKEHSLNKGQSGKMDLFPVAPTQAFLENYLGEIQGPSHAGKAWNPNNDYSFYLDYPGGFSRVFSHISNKDLPLIKRPKPGQTLKGWFLYELDCVDQEELLGLIEGARRRARKKGISFLVVCLDGRKNIPGVIEENSWGKSIYEISFFPLTKITPSESQTYFHPIFL